jgi:hypothetical protein
LSDWLSADFLPGLVSVVIPTYNRPKLLGEALGSVLEQTHDRVEAVVVDDGSEESTDETVAAWSRRFAEKGRELRFFRQEHLGGQRARNRGAREGRGEYINFLDDDDLLTADKIAEQLAAAREAGADLVYGPWVPFVELPPGYGVARPHCRRPIAANGQDPFEAWLRGKSWYLMTALLSRSFLNRVGPWDEELRLGQDVDYVARCLQHSPRMVHCPRGALYRRRHRRSLSHASLADYEDSLIRFARTLELYAAERLPGETGRRALAQYLGRHAVSYRLKGSVRAADYFETRALELDAGYRPLNAGASSRLAFQLGGFRLWAMKSRMLVRFKNLRRTLRPGRSGYRRVDRLPLAAGEEGR